jgi:acyl-[acyl-carrier-protein]-phospholipid O-acyltransferase/long-chain-fatty-acid--[acyl-carrier-protein] ligase
LGAFNDNFYKQLMLLLAIPVVPGTLDQQQVATIVFALPFVLFSGIAGHLSDKYSKNRVIVLAKAAEIGIMGLGLIGFLMYGATGYRGLLAVLFLMGIHSAFFGPSKYGILPELFRNKDLPRANGIVLMTTFLAIIFGTVSAGFLGDLLVDHGSM